MKLIAFNADEVLRSGHGPALRFSTYCLTAPLHNGHRRYVLLENYAVVQDLIHTSALLTLTARLNAPGHSNINQGRLLADTLQDFTA